MVGAHRQQREELTRFGAAEQHRRPVVANLDRAEDPDLHRSPAFSRSERYIDLVAGRLGRTFNGRFTGIPYTYRDDPQGQQRVNRELTVPDNETRHKGVPIPRNPGVALVIASNASLADPSFRASVRQMLDDQYPLVKMVEALGLEDDLTDPIRKIVENLDADVVAGIRKAVLEMLDGTQYVMPIDCNVTEQELDAGVKVDVEVLPEGGVQTIHVRPIPN